MTPAELQLLADELRDSRYTLDILQGDYTAVVALLSAKTFHGRKLVPSKDLEKYLIFSGAWLKVDALARFAPSSPPEMAIAGGVARMLLRILDRFEDFDFTNEQTYGQAAQMVGILQAAGVVTQEQSEHILSMGDGFVSKLDQLKLPPVNEAIVADAVKLMDKVE